MGRSQKQKSVVSPSFSCRFWWENRGVFTPQQRSALSRISLSRIICDNTDISKVPRHIFRANRFPHGFVSCREIPKLDLRAWRSTRTEELTEQGISFEEETAPAGKPVRQPGPALWHRAAGRRAEQACRGGISLASQSSGSAAHREQLLQPPHCETELGALRRVFLLNRPVRLFALRASAFLHGK